MKGDKIPDRAHISRYCKPTTVEDGRIKASAFLLRTAEKNLSVNWLEFLNSPTRESEIAVIRNIISAKLQIGTRAKIAILNVGEFRDKVIKESTDRRSLEVLHEPEPDDLSHSEIHNLRHNDMVIAELIRKTVKETYPARS